MLMVSNDQVNDNLKVFLRLGIASLAIVNTNVSAASSMIIWMILDIITSRIRGQEVGFISIPRLCSATVVGLVVITPSAGFVQSGYAILTGSIGGFLIHLFLDGKKRFFRIDDTLDVFSCHGLGGLIGTILTGFFSQSDVNSYIQNGIFYGRPIQLGYQILGTLVTCAYSAACTAVILLLMHFTIGIRIDRMDQVRGLDNATHGIIKQNPTQKFQRVKFYPTKKKIDELNTISVVNIIRQ